MSSVRLLPRSKIPAFHETRGLGFEIYFSKVWTTMASILERNLVSCPIKRSNSVEKLSIVSTANVKPNSMQSHMPEQRADCFNY